MGLLFNLRLPGQNGIWVNSTIFGLKMVMKSGLEKMFLKSHHAQSPFSEFFFYFIERWIFAQNYNGKWNFKPKISPIFHFYWVSDGRMAHKLGVKNFTFYFLFTSFSSKMWCTFARIASNSICTSSTIQTGSTGAIINLSLAQNSRITWIKVFREIS